MKIHENISIKERRRQKILESAFQVFARKGFEWTTMQDVADEANIGVATVFRYFPKKNKLIINVIIYILENSLPTFQQIFNEKGTGYEKFEQLLNHYIRLSEPGSLNNMKLLEAFETYIVFAQEPLEDLDEYYAAYAGITNIISDMIQQGKQDGSIRQDIAIVEVMGAIANAFGIFTRKLSFFESMRMGKLVIVPAEQAEIVKNVFLEYLQPKK
ncbi:TetR/AcrR family transcriptional regulator [Solibacillus sp. CAU 1738]|uniref:TetR/AcrR family transcriptional regulator n=1 Tax=Solibacillus sp. CAU 1738 TaxID=3140363 RepID=UPI00326130CB